MKSLEKILLNIEYKLVKGDLDTIINGIEFDSRKVEPSFIFFAIKGTTNDGHLFVNQAIKNGASCIVAENIDPTWNCKNIVKVHDTSFCLSIAAANFYDNPSKKLKLIGVTGTNGKTTTATLLYHLFKQSGYISGLISTINIIINDLEIETTHTTPDALKLNQILSQMVQHKCTHVFMEVSSHAIAQYRIAGLNFTAGIFTNITHDHLDFHKTFKNYLDTKKRFFDNLSNNSFCLVNADDRNHQYLTQNTKAALKTYSLKNPSTFKAKIIENDLNGLHLKIGEYDFYSNKIGKFNAYNLLAVYATASLLGLENNKILEKLSYSAEVNGRFQFVYKNPHFKAIVDYAHTPDALENVIKTILETRKQGQRLITVFGCGGNRDKTKRPMMGNIASMLSDFVIVTSDNPRHEKPEEIIKDIISGIDEENKNRFIVIEDREQAIKTACSFAKAHDLILVAGKGHENYQEIKGVKTHFDDKEILLKYLKN